ncbi:MAG: chaperonin GroEL, partial [Turicibacter sp.]
EEMSLPEGIKMSITKDFKKNYIRVKFSRIKNEGPTMHEYVNKIGLLDSKSSTKFIPKDYLYNSLSNRIKLLKGLEATDGHINKKGLLEYSTVSDQLKDDVIELLNGLGKFVSYRKHDRKEGCSYSMTPIHRIVQLKGYKYGTQIRKIEETQVFTEMQCIRVSNPDHLYITNDYIVTHNTSTSTIITQAIIEKGLLEISRGVNSVEIKQGIDKACNLCVDYLKSVTEEVGDDFEKIKNIATISANNDEEIGGLIYSAVKMVSKDGIIMVEESKNSETSVEVVEGMQWDRGYIHPLLANNPEKLTCEFDNPHILVYDGTLSSLYPIGAILNEVHKNGQSLLIVCEDVIGEALPLMLQNKIKGLNICAIKSPGFGDRRKDILEDIAIATGAAVVSDERGLGIDDVQMCHLGRCEKVSVGKEKTTFVKGCADEGQLADRVATIKSQMGECSQLVKESYQERLSKLSGGVAVIYVGAGSEVELKEKRDRVDDALCATRAAIEEGVVIGGGTSLLRASEFILGGCGDGKDHISLGVKIFCDAIKLPFINILINAGWEPDLGDVVINEIISNEDRNIGFDAKSMELCDMVEYGII